MKNRKPFFVFTAILFAMILGMSSCVELDYLGKSYPATQQVDLYLNEQDIDREYETMGHLNAEMPKFMSMEKMQTKMMEKAREKGADGIIMGAIDIRVTGTSENSSGSSDGDNWGSSTTTSNNEVKMVKATLIKYKN